MRTPIIPDATDSDDNIRALAAFIRTELAGAVERWELCMFNRAASAKYEAMGREWSYQNKPSISIEKRDHLLRIASEQMDCEVLASGVIQE